MAGCGGGPQGPEPRTAIPDGSGGTVQGCPPQVPPPSDPSGEVVTPGGQRSRRTSAEPEPSSSVCPPTGPSRPAANTAADAPAAAPLLQMAAVGTGRRHRLSTARGRRAGRCPPAQRPADMSVAAAAEGPQRFRPGGGDGTGCRTPPPPAGRSRTPDRTPEAADGQSAAGSGYLYSSSRPAWRAAACGRRPRPAAPPPVPGPPVSPFAPDD